MTDQVAGSSLGLDPTRQGLRLRTGAARPASVACQGATAPAARARTLQLVLSCLWLLDSILQFQAFMFGRGFAAMLRASAAGNPAVIAAPITWSARFIQQHDVTANAAFATIQLAIALGIAWRPTIKIALGMSIAWSLGVWWLGEGLGGLLSGTASPASGAPGAVILYALLAILLWPPRRADPAPFVAARAVGATAARLTWLVVWGGLAVLALLPATRAPRALATMIAGMSAGQPAWLAGLDHRIAAFLGHRGPAAAVLLAAVLAVVAAGIYLPRPAIRGVLMLAIATAGALWLAQGMGGLLTASATDPDTAPLLALLAIAYWPLALTSTPAASAAGATGARG
jgi:hypothetical protein